MDIECKRKTIYIVGTNGLPVRYGGWDMLLHHLTLGLSEDYKIYVYTSSFEAKKNVTTHNGAIIKLVPLKANGLQSIFYDFFTMLDASIRGADYILVLGVSGGIFFPFFKAFKSIIILNPDGAEWKRSKFTGWIKGFLKFSERLGVKYSDRVISDSKVISSDLAIDYGVDSSVIEYGSDHATATELREITASLYGIQKRSYAFKVCRIVPENNIVMILEAFAKSNHKLVIIGNWDNSQFGIEVRNRFRHYENFSLLDPIYDQLALDELRSNCRLYVHGHSVGGTNPSLVEAMYLALPCLVFDVSYNRETTEEAARYFASESDILSALDELWSRDDYLDSMGKKLNGIAKRRYSWSDIVKKYRYVIESGK
ncbi:DUF1972 domain-containing protein [Gammaproteobacteria bacterium]|nr:DUF1972 domain-containing protein [Gammaproteobacteria bacterium]